MKVTPATIFPSNGFRSSSSSEIAKFMSTTTIPRTPINTKLPGPPTAVIPPMSSKWRMSGEPATPRKATHAQAHPPATRRNEPRDTKLTVLCRSIFFMRLCKLFTAEHHCRHLRFGHIDVNARRKLQATQT